MNTCNTCKHWEKVEQIDYSDLPAKNWQSVRNSGGYCRSDQITEEWSNEHYKPNSLVYPYIEQGEFWTGPDFGCVHHSEGQP